MTTSSLYTVFTAADNGLELLVCSSPDGVTWSPNTWTGAQGEHGMIFGTAIAAFGGQIWLACVEYDSFFVLLQSSADGSSWSQYGPFGEEPAYGAPQFAVFDSKLWIAYVGSHNTMWISSTADGTNWSPLTQIPNQTGQGLALAVFQGQLYLFFTANDTSNSIVYCTSPDGVTWSSASFTGQSTLEDRAPAAAVCGGILYVAFVSNDTSDPALLVCASKDGANWTANTATGYLSLFTPSLATYQNQLWLEYVSFGNALMTTRSTDGTTWSTPNPINQSSGQRPSLCAVEAAS